MNLFRFIGQFSDWVSNLKKLTETVPFSDDRAESAEQKWNRLKFQKNNLIYLLDSGNYMQHPSKRSVYDIKIAEHAINF